MLLLDLQRSNVASVKFQEKFSRGLIPSFGLQLVRYGFHYRRGGEIKYDSSDVVARSRKDDVC